MTVLFAAFFAAASAQSVEVERTVPTSDATFIPVAQMASGTSQFSAGGTFGWQTTARVSVAHAATDRVGVEGGLHTGFGDAGADVALWLRSPSERRFFSGMRLGASTGMFIDRGVNPDDPSWGGVNDGYGAAGVMAQVGWGKPGETTFSFNAGWEFGQVFGQDFRPQAEPVLGARWDLPVTDQSTLYLAAGTQGLGAGATITW